MFLRPPPPAMLEQRRAARVAVQKMSTLNTNKKRMAKRKRPRKQSQDKESRPEMSKKTQQRDDDYPDPEGKAQDEGEEVQGGEAEVEAESNKEETVQEERIEKKAEMSEPEEAVSTAKHSAPIKGFSIDEYHEMERRLAILATENEQLKLFKAKGLENEKESVDEDEPADTLQHLSVTEIRKLESAISILRTVSLELGKLDSDNTSPGRSLSSFLHSLHHFNLTDWGEEDLVTFNTLASEYATVVKQFCALSESIPLFMNTLPAFRRSYARFRSSVLDQCMNSASDPSPKNRPFSLIVLATKLQKTRAWVDLQKNIKTVKANNAKKKDIALPNVIVFDTWPSRDTPVKLPKINFETNQQLLEWCKSACLDIDTTGDNMGKEVRLFRASVLALCNCCDVYAQSNSAVAEVTFPTKEQFPLLANRILRIHRSPARLIDGFSNTASVSLDAALVIVGLAALGYVIPSSLLPQITDTKIVLEIDSLPRFPHRRGPHYERVVYQSQIMFTQFLYSIYEGTFVAHQLTKGAKEDEYVKSGEVGEKQQQSPAKKKRRVK